MAARPREGFSALQWGNARESCTMEVPAVSANRVAAQTGRRRSPLRNMQNQNGAKAFQFMLAALHCWDGFEVDAQGEARAGLVFATGLIEAGPAGRNDFRRFAVGPLRPT
jgi:hypothetical protein